MAWGVGETLLLVSALLSAGSTVYSSEMASQAARKGRKMQAAATAKARKEAERERKRIEGLDKERLERLRKKGAGLPGSLLTGMSGITGEATLKRQLLGA